MVSALPFIADTMHRWQLCIIRASYNRNKMASNQGEIESSNNQFKGAQLQQTIQPIQFPQPQPPINHNGFTNCLTIYQILPMAYASLMLIQIILLSLYLQGKILLIALLLTYIAIFITLCILWFITTNIDPTDSTQILHKQTIKNKMCFDTRYYKYFCHICQTCVSKNSFHCKKCNRCVDMFDHHCKWLNNCIGAKNYLEFLALICSTEILMLFHFIVNCVHVVYICKTMIPLPWILYLEALFIALDFIVLIANSALLSVHLFLVFKKKTTLQLILEKRKINAIHPSYSGQNHQQHSNEKKQEKIQKVSQSDDKFCKGENQTPIRIQGKFKLSLKSSLRKPLPLEVQKTFSLKSRPRSSFK